MWELAQAGGEDKQGYRDTRSGGVDRSWDGP